MLNTAKMSISNIIMYALPVIVTPVLSRLYGPAAFGDWGIFSSFVTILTIAIFLGYDNTIVKTESDTDTKTISFLCMGISSLIIVLTGIIFYFGKNTSLHFFQTFPDTLLLIFYLIFFSGYTILYNLCNKYEKYNTLSLSSIVQGGAQAVFRILFGVISITAFNGLILGTTIAQGCCVVFLLISFYKESGRFRNIAITPTDIKRLVIKYKNFPLYDAPSSLLSFAAFNLPVLILAMYFDKASIGCFSIVLQLLLLPMSLIGSAMGRVYYQELCSSTGNINSNVNQKSKEILQVVSIISILPLLFLACGGDKLIILFLGAKWQTAGDVALCLSLWSFPTVLTQPLLPLFRYLNKQKTLLYFDIAYFIGGIGSIYIGCRITHNLYMILIVYAAICFMVKSALFGKIISITRIQINSFKKSLLLWGLSLCILAIRLIEL